jgi:hypothetical protein
MAGDCWTSFGNGNEKERPALFEDVLSRLTGRINAAVSEIGEVLGKIKTCPAPCRDGTISIAMRSGGTRRTACPLADQGCAYGQAEERKLERFLGGIMFEAGVPARHIGNFPGCFDTRAVTEASLWDGSGFLILSGGLGSGKSFAAAWVVKKYLRGHVSDWLERQTWANAKRAGESVLWSGADEISGDKESALRTKRAGLLVIDDLGYESGDRTERAVLRNVISRRYDSALPTIVTTELVMADIAELYGWYVAERFAEDMANGGRIVDCGNVSVWRRITENSPEIWEQWEHAG